MQSGLRCAMSLDDLEQDVKKVLRAMAKKQKILVYCDQGRRNANIFILFVIILIQGGSDVRTGDSGRDGRLSQAVECASDDLEIQRLKQAIPPEITAGMSRLQIMVSNAITNPEHATEQDSTVQG